MAKVLKDLLLASLAVFAPIKAVIITTLVLVIADMISGMLAAKKQGQPITSSGIKKTVGKILLYEMALMLAYLAEQYLIGSLLPVCKIVGSLIGLTEIKSILENVDIINGSSIFAGLLSKIVQSESDDTK